MHLGASPGRLRLECTDDPWQLGELLPVGFRKRGKEFRGGYAKSSFRGPKRIGPHAARLFRRAESLREPLSSAALPQPLANSGLPSLAKLPGEKRDVERIARRPEEQCAQYGTDDVKEAELLFGYRPDDDLAERSAAREERRDRADPRDAMTRQST